MMNLAMAFVPDRVVVVASIMVPGAGGGNAGFVRANSRTNIPKCDDQSSGRWRMSARQHRVLAPTHSGL
jgi:hypothetical protein